MREIKFRAWDKRGKKMLTPLSGILWGKPVVPTDYVQGLFSNNEIPENYEYSFEGEMMGVNDCELMQYTGIVDKNGKEIYEGDILGVDDPGDSSQAVVEFHQGGFKAHLIKSHLYMYIDEDWIVIGNICENPELIR